MSIITYQVTKPN